MQDSVDSHTTNSSPVIVTLADGVMQIVINAPEARNSMSAKGVVEGILAALDQLEREPELRCAVLTGAGGAFSSGGNLQDLSSKTEAQVRAQMSFNTWLYRRIALCDKLVIAAVDGPAYGAGLGLATCCDWIVAGESAAFCSAFVRVGAMPDAGLFWSLPSRLGAAGARRMMLLGKEVRGAEALAMGLVDDFVSEGSALPAAMDVAARFAQGPTRAYGRIKAGLRQAPMSVEQALQFQLDNGPGLFASEDFKEGAQAFLEKRKPVFKGR
jgi:2-(1,2-epoxy-1,2-dihydrophenyl)acetyl-CoA isomerase